MKTVPVCFILVETHDGQYWTHAVAKSMKPDDINIKIVNKIGTAFAKKRKKVFVFADCYLQRVRMDKAHQLTKDYSTNTFRKVYTD